MAEIKNKTLVLAIQALDSEIQIINSLEEDEMTPDVELYFKDISVAADDLKQAYEKERKKTPSLPSYDSLIEDNEEEYDEEYDEEE